LTVGKSTWRALRGGFEGRGSVTSRLPLSAAPVVFLSGSPSDAGSLLEKGCSLAEAGTSPSWSHVVQKKVSTVASSILSRAHAEHTIVLVTRDGGPLSWRWAFQGPALMWGRGNFA